MRSSGRPSSRQTPLRTAAGLAALLVTLLGLLAMHGLANHGTAGHGSMPGMSAPVRDLTSADVHASEHASVGSGSTTSDTMGSSPAGGHTNSGLVELCLAIVGGLLLLAAGVALAWGRRSVAAVLAARRHVVAGVRARDPVPPDLHLLCVQRC